MSDQCKHCVLRGDIKSCENTPCFHRESWYVAQFQARHAALVEAVKKMLAADDDLLSDQWSEESHKRLQTAYHEARAEVDRLLAEGRDELNPLMEEAKGSHITKTMEKGK